LGVLADQSAGSARGAWRQGGAALSAFGIVEALCVFGPVRVGRLPGLLPAVVLPASRLRRLLLLSLPLALEFLERRPLPIRHELSLSPGKAPDGALGPAPGTPRQMTRTFWASSPLRPGATSNSTRWPSSRER